MADTTPEGLDSFIGNTPTPKSEEPTGLNEFISDEPTGLNEFVDDQPTESHYGPPKALSDTAYDIPPEQAGAALEGAAKGVAGPIATGLELGAHKLGLDSALGVDTSAEAQKQREEDYPVTSGVAQAGVMAVSIMTGVGIPGMISTGTKAAGALAAANLTSKLAKVGSAVLTPFVEGVALQGSDEASKALLGQGDPDDAVCPAIVCMGGAGILNATTHGVFSALGKGGTKGLAAVENAKLGDRAEKILTGMGAAAKAHAAGVPFEDAEKFLTEHFKDFGAEKIFNYNNYKDGVGLYYNAIKKAGQTAARLGTDFLAGLAGVHYGGSEIGPALAVPLGLASDIIVRPMVEKVVQKPLLRLNKYVMPTVLRAMEKGETSGLFNVLNHTENVAKGAKAINSGIESLFKGAGQQAINDLVSDKEVNAIKDYIDSGGITQEMQDALKDAPQPGQEQQYAKGGKVQPKPEAGSLSELYPEQSMMMSAAKSRMSNYLNSLKPQKNAQKLPYDRTPDQRDQHKTYNEAVHIAAKPLKVLNHIKDGSLQLDHMKHLNGMYPELTQHLQKKLTARMMQSQLDDEQPKSKTKQAMALFLSAPLETYMTPQGIIAAQSAFISKLPQQPQGKPAGSTKKGTTNLGKSNKSYQTPEQAAENYKSNRK